MLNAHLTPDCNNAAGCLSCAEPVKQAPHGGWYITMGHAGFNSPANNRLGYATKRMAVKAYAGYAKARKATVHDNAPMAMSMSLVWALPVAA